MKINKKLGALAASSLLACTLAVPTLAFAADNEKLNETYTTEGDTPNMAQKDNTNDYADGALSGDTNTDVTGTIKATNVKITVPTKSAFNLNPWVDAAKTDAQIENPTNFELSNYSPFPVFAKVSKVAVAAPTSATVTAVNLVASTDALTKNGDVLLALSSESAAPTDYTTANGFKAMTAGQDQSYFTDAAATGKIEKGTGEKEADGSFKTPSKMTMKFYGQAFDDGENGWQAGDSFVLTPTFTVSLKSFSASA